MERAEQVAQRGGQLQRDGAAARPQLRGAVAAFERLAPGETARAAVDGETDRIRAVESGFDLRPCGGFRQFACEVECEFPGEERQSVLSQPGRVDPFRQRFEPEASGLAQCAVRQFPPLACAGNAEFPGEKERFDLKIEREPVEFGFELYSEN